jgi:hypothetical protein
MPPTDTTNPTKAALEAAVLDLTDEEIVEALSRIRSSRVKQAYEDRRGYTWPREAQRNVLDALAKRIAGGRVRASG